MCGGFFPPFACFAGILRHAFTQNVKRTEFRLRLRVAVLRFLHKVGGLGVQGGRRECEGEEQGFHGRPCVALWIVFFYHR